MTGGGGRRYLVPTFSKVGGYASHGSDRVVAPMFVLLSGSLCDVGDECTGSYLFVDLQTTENHQISLENGAIVNYFLFVTEATRCDNLPMVFTARRYASVVYAMALSFSVSVCICVCHKSVFY